MRRYKTYLIKAIIFTYFYTFYGCLDESILPSETVGGKIHDNNKLVFNYLVSPGNYPIVSTDINRNFNLEIPAKPFDLIIAENSFYGIYETVKFMNITNNRNHIIMKEWAFPEDYFSDFCSMRVYFPKFAELNPVFIKFVSKDYFREDTPFYKSVSDYHSDNSEYYIDEMLYLPKDKNSTEGKIYYLEAITDYKTGNITSCERFGIKDVTIRKGNNEPIRFTETELAYNPPERIVPLNISFPEGYACNNAAVSLSIPGYSKCSDFVLYNYFSFNTQIIVPIMPPSGPKIKVFAEYREPSYGYYRGEDATYFEGGEALNLTHTEFVVIVSPRNGDENISDTTTIEINDVSSDTGIYEFFLYSSIRTISVYTDKKRIKFSDFSAWSHPLKANTYYLLAVRKYPDYNSVDEFLSTPYVVNSKHRYIELSRDIRFKTSP